MIVFFSAEDKADVYFSSAMVNPNLDAKPDAVYFYPHSFDCLSIIVPVVKNHESFLHVFVKQPLISTMAVVIFLLVTLRIICRLESADKAIVLTFGVFCSQIRVPHSQCTSDRIWTACMLICSLLVTIILSQTIFEILIKDKYEPEIDTFQQLIVSNLKIYVKEPTVEDFYVFQK